MKKEIQRTRDELISSKRIVIATHINPEGDALGSALAIYHWLLDKGKEVLVYERDGVPYFLEFLPGVKNLKTRIEDIKIEPDKVVVVDCADLLRTGEEFLGFAKGRHIINIDHHETNSRFGKLNLIDETASSSGEIIYSLVENELTNDIANCLYTAIMMDTGGFRFSNTTFKTLDICARLVKAGASPSRIAHSVYESHPPGWLKLLSLALSTLEFGAEGRRAEIVLTQEMFRMTGTGAEFSEGFINYLTQVGTVEVAIVYRENGKNKYKLSFRSNGKINVAHLAMNFGGGGHPQAAGATINGSLDYVKKLVREKVDELLLKK